MKITIHPFFAGLAAGLLMLAIYSFVNAEDKNPVYEYKQFSTIESVVPGGLGRSRILTTDDKGTVVEKELQNFYSMVGINFGNIAGNDRTIVEKVNEWTGQGWELYSVTSGSQTNMSSGSSSTGIFLTRFLFRRVRS